MNATGRVNSPSMSRLPPTTSIQPAARSSGVSAKPAGMPPNQPKSLSPPGQMNSNAVTILSNVCVTRANTFGMIYLPSHGWSMGCRVGAAARRG